MRRTLFISVTALSLAGCNHDAGAPQLEVGASISLTSSAFADGQPIPKTFARGGENHSPPLIWGDAPPGVKSYALVCDDPDAPMQTWVHWVMWNIPASARALPEGAAKDASLPDGERQGKNDFDAVGYDGPDPPGGPPHHYYFRLYALDKMLALPPGGATRQQLDQSMTGHVLGHGRLMGTYQK